MRDHAVLAWADGHVLNHDVADIPPWLLDLSAFGPGRMMAGPAFEFIPVPTLSFAQRFSLRGQVLDLGDVGDVERFVLWIARAAMGEDLEVPAVRFGYHVEHLWGDCSRMDLACELVRTEMPELLKHAVPVPSELISMARDTKRERG